MVVGDHKLVGSAQRRSKGGVLQHGSLLIAKSSYAPSLVGLHDLLPNEGEARPRFQPFAEELCVRIERGIDALLGVSVQWDADLLAQLHLLATVKMARFAAPEWRSRV